MPHWFTQQEQALLNAHLPHYFGYELLVLGELSAKTANKSPVSHHSAIVPELLLGTEGAVAHWHQLPLAPDSIDIILAKHAIEQLTNPSDFLTEMHKVLRHDGYLLLCQFNAWHPQAYELHKQVIKPLTNEQGKLYSPSHLKNLLKAHGFEMVRTHRYGRQVAMRHASGIPSKLQHLAYRLCPSLSLGYLMVAQKVGHCLTPIAPRKFWQNMLFSRKVMTQASCSNHEKRRQS